MQVTIEIYSTLKLCGYAIPVSDTDDLLLLKKVCTAGAGYMVERSRYSEVSNTESPHGLLLWNEYRKYLTDFKDGKLVLLNTLKAVSASNGGGVPRFGYDTNDLKFTKDMLL